VEWVQGAAAAGPGGTQLEPRPLRPFGDLRGTLEIAGSIYGGLDLGGGIELSWFRIGLFFRLFPNFGLTPRFQFALPALPNLNVLLEVGLPLDFLSGGLGLGFNGAGGVEYYPFQWIGGYVLIGGQHTFLWPGGRNADTAFTTTVGVRLRVP
jgi:hypothetical protein